MLPLGFYYENGKYYMFYGEVRKKTYSLFVAESEDGAHFNTNEPKPLKLTNFSEMDERTRVHSFSVSMQGKSYVLSFVAKFADASYTYIAKSKDLQNWKVLGRAFPLTDSVVLIPNYKKKYHYVLYGGGRSVYCAESNTLTEWNIEPETLIPQKANDRRFRVGSVSTGSNEILVTYFEEKQCDDYSIYALYSITFDAKNPRTIISHPEVAFWQQPQQWIGKDIHPVGMVDTGSVFVSFWYWAGFGLFQIIHHPQEEPIKRFFAHASLNRLHHNPILEPRTGVSWESRQVFNPAAVLEDDKVHLLYRAIGDGETSVLGYAASHDGLHFDIRPELPAYIPRAIFELPQNMQKPLKLSPYESGGGGYGGCEDPRLTKIDEKFYLTYVAYDGANPPRVALSSIEAADFRDGNWSEWSMPTLVSPPGIVNKNACILPEKINGKYVIFHRVFPDILVDYVDSLEFDGAQKWLTGHHAIHPRPDFWDSRKIGIGAPPIRTKYGWLAIYQAVGNQDSGRYKIGAMLLDLDQPEKVLYRSSHPILSPESSYENDGFKAGVVYPCGAVVLNGELIVYYGGADTYVAAATANLDEFLDQLKYNGDPQLTPIKTQL
jgi:beta-1,2-mannobiose phosphorylase / 1,2-beta-oligomannan phosphorylase